MLANNHKHIHKHIHNHIQINNFIVPPGCHLAFQSKCECVCVCFYCARNFVGTQLHVPVHGCSSVPRSVVTVVNWGFESSLLVGNCSRLLTDGTYICIWLSVACSLRLSLQLAGSTFSFIHSLLPFQFYFA